MLRCSWGNGNPGLEIIGRRQDSPIASPRDVLGSLCSSERSNSKQPLWNCASWGFIGRRRRAVQRGQVTTPKMLRNAK